MLNQIFLQQYHKNPRSDLEAGLQGCLARVHFEFLVLCINLTGREFILQICKLLVVPFAASS